MINGELIIDNFAGGGGASTGIEIATGQSVDVAINHDPKAILMHKTNHPSTKHYCESDRSGLVELQGEQYAITDIGLRMLEPSELYRAQGFTDDYIIDHDYKGNTYTRSEQVKRCGNAVPPPFAAALVKANLPELCIGDRKNNLNPYRLKEGTGGQMRFA